MSSTSSTFLEAILLPWNLLLTGKNGNLCSRDLMNENKKVDLCGNTNGKEQVPIKRQKLVDASRDSLPKDEVGYSLCGLSACSNSFSNSGKQNPVNLSSQQIPCQVTLGNIPHETINSSAILQFNLSTVYKDVGFQQTGRIIFLEISCESFMNYQVRHAFSMMHLLLKYTLSSFVFSAFCYVSFSIFSSKKVSFSI